MAVKQNKWVEKERKKRGHETAPAFKYDPIDEWDPIKAVKTVKRHSPCFLSASSRTLRGVRK